MNAPAAPRPALPWALPFLLTALAYALVGRTALLLAIPPGYASPLYPSAGLALAAVLVYGWRVAPAVALGAFVINLSLNLPRTLDAASLAVPALIASGAALQALFGAALVRRFVPQPVTLTEPRDIALFFLVGALTACTLNASLAALVLGASGIVPLGGLPFTWLTWWIGDSLGSLIGAPIVLTLIGRPREDWAPRRLTVGLTLGVVTTLLAVMIVLVVRWDEQRARSSFDREADSAVTAVSFKLHETLHALEAMRGVYIASDSVDSRDVAAASAAWLQHSSVLQALGFAQHALRADWPQLEAQARADGYAGFRVMDRPNGDPAPSQRVPVAGAEAFVIRQIEPRSGNEGALGVNLLSIPAARRAVDSAIATGQPAATAAFRLSQDGPGSTSSGVVVYQAVLASPRTLPVDPRARVKGAVFVTLRVEQVLRALAPQLPPYLQVCLFDAEPAAAISQLAGPPACAAAPAGFTHQRTLAFAGRQWNVRIDARAAELPSARQNNAWLFSVVGLLSTAVLGALLLMVTGRTRRIEAAVRQRTAALQEQVHEREQAEVAMRESEQRFRNIFNNVPLGVVYTDLDGAVKQTNPHFCELVGHSADALLAMNARDYTHPEDALADRDAIRRLVAGEITTDRRQKRYVTRGGRIVWVQSTLSLLRDERGAPQRIVSAAEDITENLRLADADRARRAAEASNRAKSEFLSRMSHELRTPLNAMLGFAQLLDLDRRHPLNDTQRPWVGQIQQAGWHLLEMINDVLDLSRIESGNLRLAVEPLDVGDLMAATLPLLQREALSRGVEISEALSPDAQRVLGDSTRVKQILTNLLSNAVKYNVEGGLVHVASERVGEMVEITVTDTGHGMTPTQMGELFQPFNRLGRELSGTEGTGIGLVISQRLAELMGGGLRARSVTGEGSSFILSLPFGDDPDTVRSPLDELPASEPAYHRRHVHYVEDNETNVEVMRGILAQRPQVQLDVSLTGLDGLAAIRARRPDVILLDMHLPDISGMELLRHLQNDPQTADIPVVIVSADALESQIVEAVALGAYRYLTKPVNVGQLLAVLDGLLSEAVTQFG